MMLEKLFEIMYGSMYRIHTHIHTDSENYHLIQWRITIVTRQSTMEYLFVLPIIISMDIIHFFVKCILCKDKKFFFPFFLEKSFVFIRLVHLMTYKNTQVLFEVILSVIGSSFLEWEKINQHFRIICNQNYKQKWFNSH